MHLPLRWWPSWMQRNHQLTLFRPQVAYIFLPIVVDEWQGETEIIATLKQQDFAHVGHVLAAMFESDEEFQEYLNSIYYTQVVTPDVGYKPGSGKSRSGSGFTVRDADTREEMVAGDLRNMLTATSPTSCNDF